MAPPSELIETARPAEDFLGLKHLGPQTLILQQDEEARKAYQAFAAQAPSTSLRCENNNMLIRQKDVNLICKAVKLYPSKVHGTGAASQSQQSVFAILVRITSIR